MQKHNLVAPRLPEGFPTVTGGVPNGQSLTVASYSGSYL